LKLNIFMCPFLFSVIEVAVYVSPLTLCKDIVVNLVYACYLIYVQTTMAHNLFLHVRNCFGRC
jgi:hypothetical protein